jgi:hypothetical protein
VATRQDFGVCEQLQTHGALVSLARAGGRGRGHFAMLHMYTHLAAPLELARATPVRACARY